MTPTTSLVPVSKATVLAAADRMLEAVQERRQAERARWIAVLMTHRRWIWFGRFHTEAEAIAMVNTSDEDDECFPYPWTLWPLVGSDTEALAKQLQQAASVTQGQEIWLNLDDAAQVAAHS